MMNLSSGQVASLFDIETHRLEYLTRDRKIRPRKGPTGAFAWSYEDVQRAAELLHLPALTEADFSAIAESGVCPPNQRRGGDHV